jgi:Cu+-exporting ATPase
MKDIVFAVEGMTCQNCVRHVKEALIGVEGISEAHVSLEDSLARVSYDPASASLYDMAKAVEEAGYKIVENGVNTNTNINTNTKTSTIGDAGESEMKFGPEPEHSGGPAHGAGAATGTETEKAREAETGKTVETAETAGAAKVSHKVLFPVEGMHCASCALTIERALQKKTGVKTANVNFASEKAMVTFDPQLIDLDNLQDTVRKAGYDVPTGEKKVTLSLGGMTCASCAATIEKALAETEGVVSARVNFATEKATVEYDSTVTGVLTLKQAVSNAGYRVIERDSETEKEDDDLKKVRNARRKMITAWGFTAPIIGWMVAEMFFGIMWPSRTVMIIGMTLLAVPVVYGVGWQTIRSALKAVFHGRANMDVLIAMGTTASFLTGPAAVFTTVANYAGISAMIMAIHLTGRFIENSARGRASQAIKKLLELGAKTARILVEGKEKEVPIEEVRTGDTMIVRPGEKIPTDGLILEGEGSVDESMATGESMPALRGPDDEVIGATINQEGFLRVKATRVGKDTFLAQVIRMVEECQGSKVPIQEFADRVTAYFVPIILGIAAITVLSWLLFPGLLHPVITWASSFIPWVNPEMGRVTLAIFSGVAVLVIACPCALGLATPTALMVGSGIGAENGVLIRQGEAIQTLKDTKIIVFDKTGTITKGKPEVTDIIPFNGFDSERLLGLAASVESGSEHPLGRAVVNRAVEQGVHLESITDFRAVRGKGVQARLNGKTVTIGSGNYVRETGVETEQAGQDMGKLESEAKTLMLVAVDGKLAGILGVADALKEDSVRAVAELEAMGIETAMITGDNVRTARAIAEKVGISRVLAELLPEGKVNEIKRLQEMGHNVAMVGDGINDAPALTQANIGIAIGTGTDIAIEASDVTLVRGDLSGVVTAVKLSRATFRKIKQNLFWAFFYNTIAIPAAILGFLHPIIAEAAMATSSINVVTNANLLRWVKITPDYEGGAPK